MAEFELLEVSGIEASLKAMRLPMGSEGDTEDTWLLMGNRKGRKLFGEEDKGFMQAVGEKDWSLAKKLASVRSGTGHDCFLKGITVHLEVEAPHYWWNQAQRYHWFDIISSSSKMHMLLKGDVDDKCSPNVFGDTTYKINQMVAMYNNFSKLDEWAYEDFFDQHGVEKYPKSKEELYECILDNLPMGYQLKAGIVTNYLQLKTMYRQRKSHKLSHWNEDFVKFIKGLPLSELITGDEK